MLTKYATIVSLPTKLKSAKPDVEKKGTLGWIGKGQGVGGGGGGGVVAIITGEK